MNNNFVYVNSEFEKKFAGPLSARWVTYKTALNLLTQLHYPSINIRILETGCQRMEDDWGGGCSTWVFADYLTHYATSTSSLYTVDNNRSNLDLARAVIAAKFPEPYDFEFIPMLGDSIEILHNLHKNKLSFDFAYLDSMDCDPREPEGEMQTKMSQVHQLNEAKVAVKLLDPYNNYQLLMLDDNNLPWGGKCTLTKEFLFDEGWTCVFDFQQSLWLKV